MAVLIRLAGEGDAAAIASIYRFYVEDSRISFEEVAPTRPKWRGGWATSDPSLAHP